MKLAYVYDHHNAGAEWHKRDLQEWLTDTFEAPQIRLREGSTREIRAHVRAEFEKEGWAIGVKIDQDLGLAVFAMRADLAFHLQTGNMSRAAYDLLKLQYLYHSGRIEASALALPTKSGAEKLGSNVAHAERICNELQLFNRIITVPMLIIAFE